MRILAQEIFNVWPIALMWCAVLFGAQDGPNDEAGERKPAPRAGLIAENIYHGVQRPVMVHVTSPRSFGTVTLALMDFDGQLLAEPIEVHPGRIDLAEKLPRIWELRRTAYLQMMDLNQPVGSALVLQPMLSRMVPQTREEVHPVRGIRYSRIVGWVDENQLPVDPPASATPATTPAAARDDDNATESKAPSQPAPVQEPIERLFTGLRIYPERDVIFHTTHGDIRLAMRPDEAPNTAWNFLELSRGGFYRDIQFHRIVPMLNAQPFVIQAGDPTGTGDGGPGYWMPIEDSKLQHEFGVISMARSDDPDSNGSQIFIALSREGTARLDGQYCAFGYAVDGADAIKAIAQVQLADPATGRPVDPPLIRTAEIVPAPARTPGKGRPDQRVTPYSSQTPTKPSGRIPR